MKKGVQTFVPTVLYMDPQKNLYIGSVHTSFILGIHIHRLYSKINANVHLVDDSNRISIASISKTRAMSVPKSDVIKLYRSLLRYGGRFADYNFREYALRKTRHEFAKMRNVTDVDAIKAAYESGVRNLAIVKNQAIISEMYGVGPNVLEKQK